MPKRFATDGAVTALRALARRTALATALVATSATAGAPLDFDRVFAAPLAAQSFYAATYRTGGVEHRVDVWRDGERRIKRRTDDAIETDLIRPAGSVEWTMSVLDLKRRIRTDIDRTDLLRIGHYTDWFAQSRSLTKPRATYRLTTSNPAPGPAPVAPCRWYRMTEADRSTTICWNAAAAVPLVIADGRGETVWRVTRLQGGPFPEATFAIDDRGFVRHAASQDIEAD